MSFLDNLDEEQQRNAAKVADAAEAAGIDPLFAVGIAFKEGKLRSNAPRGSKGEYGMFQVKPSTGDFIGFSRKSLNNPDENIQAGIKYLKYCLDNTGNSQALAAACYNGGPDTFNQLLQKKNIHAGAEGYVADLIKMGIVPAPTPEGEEKEEPAAAQEQAPAPEPMNQDVSEPAASQSVPPSPVEPSSSAQAINERQLAGAIGAGLGGVLAAKRAGFDVLKGGARLASTGANKALDAVGSAVAKRAAPAGGLPTAAPVSAPAAAPSQPAQPAGGLTASQPSPAAADPYPFDRYKSGTYNWAKTEFPGVPDHVLRRLIDQGYHKSSIGEKLKQLNVVLGKNADIPEFAKQAKTVEGGTLFIPEGNRTDYQKVLDRNKADELAASQRIAANQARTAAIEQNRAAAQAAAAAAANAPKPSALDKVTQTFAKLAETPVGRGISQVARPVARYLGPVAGGYGVATDLGAIAEERQKQDPSYVNMGLSGLSALGGAMGFVPALAIPGAGLSAAATGARALADRAREQQGFRLPQSSVPFELTGP